MSLESPKNDDPREEILNRIKKLRDEQKIPDDEIEKHIEGLCYEEVYGHEPDDEQEEILKRIREKQGETEGDEGEGERVKRIGKNWGV